MHYRNLSHIDKLFTTYSSKKKIGPNSYFTPSIENAIDRVLSHLRFWGDCDGKEVSLWQLSNVKTHLERMQDVKKVIRLK